MSVVIELKFPSGRYHATPWGRHVNEGVPEWPPSPWRLLRALIAVWKRTLPDIPSEQVQRILAALSDPPQFRLPDHRVAHTRHYMPWEKKGPQDRALIFDTFVAVSRSEPLSIHWAKGELSPDDRSALDRLLGNLSSLGRAEAWVEARITKDAADCNLKPAKADDLDPMPVLCLDPATAFRDDHYPKFDPKKLPSGKINPAEFLFDAPRWHLCLDTETIHKERWPMVPGTKWINYTRPIETAAIRTVARKRPTYTVARFLLDGPVLPLATETVVVAEEFRRAVMSRFNNWCKNHEQIAGKFLRNDTPPQYSCPTISGKDLSSIVRKGHEHAYFLPTCEGIDPRRVTHVTLFAREGFDECLVSALATIRRFEYRDAPNPFSVQLIGLGNHADFTARVVQKSRIWESITPFVVHRHFKRNGTKRDTQSVNHETWREDFTKLALSELLQRMEYPDIKLQSIVPASVLPRPWEFRRARRQRFNDDGFRRPCGWFRLEFSKPVVGPLAIGHNCHFGLGLFAALPD